MTKTPFGVLTHGTFSLRAFSSTSALVIAATAKFDLRKSGPVTFPAGKFLDTMHGSSNPCHSHRRFALNGTTLALLPTTSSSAAT
jgi:hypothetical protein